MDGRRPRSRPGAAGAAMEGDVDGDASLAKASPTFEVDDNFANPLAAAVGASVRVRDVGKQASTDARRFIARRGRGSWPVLCVTRSALRGRTAPGGSADNKSPSAAIMR